MRLLHWFASINPKTVRIVFNPFKSWNNPQPKKKRIIFGHKTITQWFVIVSWMLLFHCLPLARSDQSSSTIRFHVHLRISLNVIIYSFLFISQSQMWSFIFRHCLLVIYCFCLLCRLTLMAMERFSHPEQRKSYAKLSMIQTLVYRNSNVISFIFSRSRLLYPNSTTMNRLIRSATFQIDIGFAAMTMTLTTTII